MEAKKLLCTARAEIQQLTTENQGLRSQNQIQSADNQKLLTENDALKEDIKVFRGGILEICDRYD